jgi:hypothetical protein
MSARRRASSPAHFVVVGLDQVLKEYRVEGHVNSRAENPGGIILYQGPP